MFRNCNFWKVFKTCLDFEFVTDNNCENGAPGPYFAFAPVAWTVLFSALLFLNYTKYIQTSHASLCSSVAPVLCLLVLGAYFKTQFPKNHSSLSGEGKSETSHWKTQINVSRNTKFLRNFDFKILKKFYLGEINFDLHALLKCILGNSE